jgi:hypothetical protein
MAIFQEVFLQASCARLEAKPRPPGKGVASARLGATSISCPAGSGPVLSGQRNLRRPGCLHHLSQGFIVSVPRERQTCREAGAQSHGPPPGGSRAAERRNTVSPIRQALLWRCVDGVGVPQSVWSTSARSRDEPSEWDREKRHLRGRRLPKKLIEDESGYSLVALMASIIAGKIYCHTPHRLKIDQPADDKWPDGIWAYHLIAATLGAAVWGRTIRTPHWSLV